MSQITKIIIGVVGIIIIGGGAYYFWNQSERGPGEARENASQGAAFNDSTALPSGADTSDASLDQDMGAIGAQVQAAGADVANVDAAVN